MDDSGTINPAALNTPSTTIAPSLLSQPSPRGTKRSRSPDVYGGAAGGQDSEAHDAKPNKRSRPMKTESVGAASQMAPTTLHSQVQTPQIKTQSLPQASPNQSSPARSTPGSATKPTVIKALPTVRDHTTDQLGPENDEYVPREVDPDGETKVSKDGYPLDGRKYKCRTFQVPNRGEKLFMLATECARVLGYRDSYLLFNKNRSLFKIIANQQEKDALIHQEILPYSYRSRQIAIVTARSMFRQFGSRLIEGGRRVRDDYWEAKAIKQGFTEEDAAGEKRPGAAKAREAAAAEASHANALTALPHGEIIYSNGAGFDGQPPGIGPGVSLAPLPMIHLPSDELKPGLYGNIIRPRQEIAGPAFQDRTQSSNPNEILAQASQAAEYNKQLSQARGHRSDFLKNYWERPHEQPALPSTQDDGSAGTIAPHHLQSPQAVAGQIRLQQDASSHPGSQMLPQTYTGYPNQQMTSPVQTMHRPMQPSQILQNSPPMNMGAGVGHRPSPSYGYASNQMWPPPQPSPLSQSHPMQYAPHQSQSPMAPPSLPPQPGMGYGAMNSMTNPAYSGMSRGMLYQPGPSPQQQNFTMGPQSNAGPQPGMQWPAPGSQDWQRYQ